jgi:hypothetical protein
VPRFVELESGDNKVLVNLDLVVAVLPFENGTSQLMFLSGQKYVMRNKYSVIKTVLQSTNTNT